MDPNATLAELRELIKDNDAQDTDQYVLDRIEETFEALDGWLSKGGFKPDAWNVSTIQTTEGSKVIPMG